MQFFKYISSRMVQGMIFITLSFSIACQCPSVSEISPAYKGFIRGDALISVDTLKTLIDNQAPEVIIVDISDSQAYYQQGHIPGALNIWRPDYESTEKLWGIRGENIVSREDFQVFLRSLGINKDSKVVWYDHQYDATRLWWASKYYGFDTRLLDGGIAAWKAKGYAVTRAAEPTPVPGSIILKGGIPVFRVAEEAVWKSKEDPGWKLWDIRNKAEFSGKIKRARRGGRIPWQQGLISWKAFRRPDQTWKDAKEIGALLKKHQIYLKDHHVFYCQSGVRTTQAIFAMYLMGFPLEHLHNYDNSWIYWGNSPDLPIEP